MLHSRRDSRGIKPITTAASNEIPDAVNEVLRQSLDSLAQELRKDGVLLGSLASAVKEVRLCLEAASETSKLKDEFRYQHGFSALLDVLRWASGRFNTTGNSSELKDYIFQLLREVLSTLAAALRGHYGNRKYFKQRVEGGGWIALEQSIASIGFGGNGVDITSENELFGLLLAFAVDDVRLRPICQTIQDQYQAGMGIKMARNTPSAEKDDIDEAAVNVQSANNPLAKTLPTEDDMHMYMSSLLDKLLDDKILLTNADVVPLIINFWLMLPRDRPLDQATSTTCIIAFLSKTTSLSPSNLLALHSTGVLSTLLPLVLQDDGMLHSRERADVEKLCVSLATLGLSTLNDARYLIRNRSSRASDFLLRMSKMSDEPPRILFDLSLNGYASMELTLGKAFPPIASSSGYTFSAWVYVNNYDASMHTTLFGVLDPTQTCFILAYIERDTHNLILQTSVNTARPSVRFKTTKFHAKRWYHIAFTHRRPRPMGSSKATLYVDGVFVEEVKITYPLTPPPMRPTNTSTESFASFSSVVASKNHPVQAFIGTPKDLASIHDPGVVSLQWSLASAHLYDEVLGHDFLAVQYHLGPKYIGNFQDCLGSFQTYDASVALNMRQELAPPGKEESSEILSAIRGKGSSVIKENRILMSILPSAFIADLIHGDNDNIQVLHGLSKHALNNLRHESRINNGYVAVNAAIPHLNEALTRKSGICIMTGDPTVILPQTIDDALWRLGGCTAVGLKLVDRARTRQEILSAVEFFFRAIKGSWRNSEAMEREKGFATLAVLLRDKLSLSAPVIVSKWRDLPAENEVEAQYERDLLSLELLGLVLDFIGYNREQPEKSVINNPLGYRILLIDYDLWRKATPEAQKLYYRQFITFCVDSKHHAYNVRRLVKMRIPKKFLTVLKSETVLADVLPDFLRALRTLILSGCSSDIVRSLALAITYGFRSSMTTRSGTHTGRQSVASLLSLQMPGPRKSTLTSKANSVLSNFDYVSRREMFIRLLYMYESLLCERGTTAVLKKFAKMVTNKWLLFLMAEDDVRIVTLAAKILARLLVSQGSLYVTRFGDKSGGFHVMRDLLRRWWDVPTLWPILISILFGYDVADFDFERNFEFSSLAETFRHHSIMYPAVLPVIIAMVDQGLQMLCQHNETYDSPFQEKVTLNQKSGSLTTPPTPGRHRSMSLNQELQSKADIPADETQPRKERLGGQATNLQNVIRFLSEMHSISQNFRNFSIQADYIRQLLLVLYPAVTRTPTISGEAELNARESLPPDGEELISHSATVANQHEGLAVRASQVETQLASTPSSHPGRPRPRGSSLRRGSSFILLTAEHARSPMTGRSLAKLTCATSPKHQAFAETLAHTVVREVLELVIAVFLDQVLTRKEFAGFGLFCKIPSGTQEHQAHFGSYIFRNTLSQLSNTLKLTPKLLLETRVITNLSRLCVQLSEAVYEGWFLAGAESVVDFSGEILEALQQPDVAKIKSVRLCSPAIAVIRGVFAKVTLLRLSELDESDITEQEAVAFMQKLTYWQTIVLSAEMNSREDLLRLICYQLYTKLIDDRSSIRHAAADLLRMLLVQKPEDVQSLLRHDGSDDSLSAGFLRLTEMDNDFFLRWADERRQELDQMFFSAFSQVWEDFVDAENSKTEETSKSRMAKRRGRLQKWNIEEQNIRDKLMSHGLAASVWKKNAYEAEHRKYLSAVQDLQDGIEHVVRDYAKLDQDLHRPCATFDNGSTYTWELDRTEGRNRMRLRMLPDRSNIVYDYQPKRKPGTAPPTQKNLSITAAVPAEDTTPFPDFVQTTDGVNESEHAISGHDPLDQDDVQDTDALEDEFELVDNPGSQLDDNYEDKNRKVLRSMQPQEQVQHVFNITRIIGLETCEGLLVIGKLCLYFIDNVFQRSDGEIVDVTQAPVDQRDPYLQAISGQPSHQRVTTQITRNWKWEDVLSMSKRRFLFRDVAIEMFFCDGRSYLFTTITQEVRDALFSRLASKVPHVLGNSSSPNVESSWRLEALRVIDENPSALSSKFGKVFNSSAWNPAMKRWAKGELSNFHYLMFVNTMAGRTFNDLTQYPVFPWVLADYTSEELDLNDPKSFRDFSKPIGAQHASRAADFVERYRALQDMGDENPFHYGTHYSSAMIVTGYLIRLQPFVHSYMILQGGTFDHTDRLFHSIGDAWNAASRGTQGDVRELIPEFFYLPEFLTNSNKYNFGVRQGNSKTIDNVTLPPWAKGDPKIFIVKHREALESPYVSRQLHQWIDLVFGWKQRGAAAIDSVNVFHYMSYQGAIDLDQISDPRERAAKIGMIHNFGQTPQQVFVKPHACREVANPRPRRLDTIADTLTRLPFPVFELQDAVTSLVFAEKLDRLIPSTTFRLNIPTTFDKYMEWGYADNSIRFYASENRKLIGLCECTHQGQLSCAIFVDSRTLVTAGVDCVLSVWRLSAQGNKSVALNPITSLFGHRQPITTIAISRSFSAIVSASGDGQVLVWDLNRLEFVRKLTGRRAVECAQINDVTGDIMLCRGQKVALFTLNGELLLDQSVCTDHDDYIYCCAFYEGVGNEWLENNLIFTGHKRGVVNVWKKVVKNGTWALESVIRLNHVDFRNDMLANAAAAVTCIVPRPHGVYVGDEDGRVYQWDCVQRER